MSHSSDQMELREDDIRKHYDAAGNMLAGIDHTPRIGKGREAAPVVGGSTGIPTRRRFRSTTPGLVTRSTARPEGVQLIARIEGLGGDDPLTSPLEATVLNDLRRAIAIALAIAENFGEATELAAMKRDNLQGALGDDRKAAFSELLTAEALVTLSVFANAASFLLAPHATEVTADIGEVEEVLTDNGQLALHGALWELDQELSALTEEEKLVATVMAFCEKLMEKVSLRAQNAGKLDAFHNASWKVEADDLTIAGFTPARAVIALPDWALAPIAKGADALAYLGWRSPLRSTAVQTLKAGVTGDPAPWQRAGGAPMGALKTTLAAMPSRAEDRLSARMALLMPLSVTILALFWFLSGAIGLARLPSAAQTLIDVNWPNGLAYASVVFWAFVDMALAAAILWRPLAKKACIGMALVCVIYLISASLVTPMLWLDPLGPLVKILPALMLSLLTRALLEDR